MRMGCSSGRRHRGLARSTRSRWITPPPRSPKADPALPASSLVWVRDGDARPLDILQVAALADLARRA